MAFLSRLMANGSYFIYIIIVITAQLTPHSRTLVFFIPLLFQGALILCINIDVIIKRRKYPGA